MRRIHPFLPRFFFALALGLGAITALITAVLARTGELHVFSQDNIATRSDLLWGSAWGQNHSGYKLDRALYLKPDILVLGSSRTGQFRAVMAPQLNFFNAGLSVGNAGAAEPFARRLFPHHKPGLVLLGLDPWWFGEGDVAELREPKFSLDRREQVSNMIRMGVRWDMVATAPPERDALGGRIAVGWMAAAQASGFRPDGSYQYGDVILGTNPVYEQQGYRWQDGFRLHLGHAATNQGRFRAIRFDPVKIEALRMFLRYARAQGVPVVMFMTSYPGRVWQAVQDNPVQRAFHRHADQAVAALAEAEGVAYFDAMNIADFGQGDDQSIDGLHVDEVAVLATLIHMVERSPTLARFWDEPRLEMLRRLAADGTSRPNRHSLAR